MVESRRDPHDHRARVYDIRRHQLTRLRGWLEDIERNYVRRRLGPADPDYYRADRLDPNFTTRRTPRKRIPHALKESWER
jgi:hypothetical protein